MIGGHLEEYRALRQQLEEEILAIASSVDGRRFELQAPLRGLELPPGGYAMLEDEHGSRLGQVLSSGSSSATPPSSSGRRAAAVPRSGAGWGSASPAARG